MRKNSIGARIVRAALAALVVGCNAGESVEERPARQAEPGEHRVVVRMTDDMKFLPESLTISVGDTVVWINQGRMPHTSSDKPGPAGVEEHNVLPGGAEPWDSGLLYPGQSLQYVFTAPGEYTYLCVLHEAAGMIGRVTVQQ
jgi:plastocyanin